MPQEVVDAVAISGTPAEVARRLGERYARCDRVALSLPYAAPMATLAALADEARALRPSKNTF